MILETMRLVIRPFSMDDLDEIYRLVYADRAVRDAWSARTGTPDEIKAAFAREHVGRSDDFGYKAVVLKAGDVLLGLIGFQRHDPDEDTSWLVFERGPPRGWRDPGSIECELTYAFGRAYWGHGYATEAGRAMIAYGFGKMGIARIVNGTSAKNRRSVNLMRRLGFAMQRNVRPCSLGADSSAPAMVGILERENAL